MCILVLIAPLWNWNRCTSRCCNRIERFNRTFMELKLARLNSELANTPKVLIAPLWNWNLLAGSLFLSACRFNRTFMELKPRSSSTLAVPSLCFNRTFMELKLSFERECYENEMDVLIAPLWNWNEYTPLQILPMSCFNRTFMELKLGKAIGAPTLTF